MALYDSSALIDYLDGDEAVTEYVADHADERTILIQRENPAVHGGRESRKLSVVNHQTVTVWNHNI